MSRGQGPQPAAPLHVGPPSYGDRFFGRGDETVELVGLLADRARWVTITGAPGIGKTRLAVECAAELAERLGIDVEFVDLAPLSDPEQILPELARALGVKPLEGAALVDQLGMVIEAEVHVVLLDNCEHMSVAAAGLGRLLDACRGLRILATSRERLRLRVEQEFPLAPLALPKLEEAGNLDAMAANPAVALLVDRARRTSPGFGLTPTNAPGLAEACLRLDGLPLAIELAATRLKALTPSELVSRLDARMSLLQSPDRDAPPRQRTLRTAIDWSFELLSTDEQTLFRRLSVFAGPCSIADAAAVCADDSTDLLPLVESLLDKSLIRRRGDESERAEFTMLEIVKEYAAEQLAAHGEVDELRNRHASHALAKVGPVLASFGIADERAVRWAWDTAAQGETRVALQHCIASGRRAQALALAAALGWSHFVRGDIASGLLLTEGVLAWAGDRVTVQDDAEVLPALVSTGILAWAAGRLERAGIVLTTAYTMSRRQDDTKHGTIAAMFLGHVARGRADYDESARWVENARTGYQQLANPLGVAWATHDLGLLARDRGDPGEAVRLLGASCDAFAAIDAPWAHAWAATALGIALCATGEAAEAGRYLGDAVDVLHSFDDGRGVAQCVEAVAALACEKGVFEAAARLLGSAAGQRTRLGAPPTAGTRARIEATTRVVVRALGPDHTERLRADGRVMTMAETLTLVHDVAGGQAGARPASPAPDAVQLTPRERQVVVLVASGRTNRQVGRVLGIAEKTAEVHLKNVMAKMGARSRAEVAAWAGAQGLSTREPRHP